MQRAPISNESLFPWYATWFTFPSLTTTVAHKSICHLSWGIRSIDATKKAGTLTTQVTTKLRHNTSDNQTETQFSQNSVKLSYLYGIFRISDISLYWSLMCHSAWRGWVSEWASEWDISLERGNNWACKQGWSYFLIILVLRHSIENCFKGAMSWYFKTF